MSVKIRLQRYGRKQAPYYHIVVADARAPRDGKFIENIGSYLPNSQPAKIELNFEKAVNWLMKGAQPTDTCRAILSYKGVLYKKHLLEGVTKGALTTEAADAKFNAWMDEKNSKVVAHTDRVSKFAADSLATKLADEKKANEARIAKIAAKIAAEDAELAANQAAENVTEEATSEETADAVETPAAEEGSETPTE